MWSPKNSSKCIVFSFSPQKYTKEINSQENIVLKAYRVHEYGDAEKFIEDEADKPIAAPKIIKSSLLFFNFFLIIP